MRDIRDYFHIPNAYITEQAESSIKTTERIMAINTDQDIMRATARRYEQAVIGPVGEFTCYIDHDQHTSELIAALKEEVESLKKDKRRLEKIIDKYIE